MSTDVVGLGFAAMDVVLNTEDLPKEDGFSFVHEERLLSGGSCANAMVAVVRMGGSVSLISKVGDDHYGKAFIKELKQCGVPSSRVLIKTGGTTLHNFIAVTRGGAKSMFSHLGDSLLTLSEDDVQAEMLQGANVFYNDMIPAKPAIKLARICNESGIPVVSNLQVGPGFMELCGVPRYELEEMLGLCDLFITNQHFMTELAGKDNCMAAAAHIDRIFRPAMGVIVTMSEKGAGFFHDKEFLQVPGMEIAAVDTTGAGDAFSGGLLYSRFVRGWGMKESIEFANGCAALKCTQPGPRLKASEADILNFIRRLSMD